VIPHSAVAFNVIPVTVMIRHLTERAINRIRFSRASFSRFFVLVLDRNKQELLA